MDDQELAAIRAARLNQLRQDSSGAGEQVTSGNGDSAEDVAKRASEEQMRRELLATVLDSAARERRMLSRLRIIITPIDTYNLGDAVARIALVSPARSKQVETILLRMAQSGQLRGRVGEAQLIGLLEQVWPRLLGAFPCPLAGTHSTCLG